MVGSICKIESAPEVATPGPHLMLLKAEEE